jgi:nucleotide-binding universal stress UspA family protein
MYRRIAVGFDGSQGARRALEVAVNLARSAKAELFLVSIEELPRYPAAIDEVDDEQRSAERFFKEIQDEAVQQITGAGLVVHREIRPGHAAQLLPHYAMEVGADLLVIGHSGHSAIWGRLLGTTADKVVEHAPCSVLVVR